MPNNLYVEGPSKAKVKETLAVESSQERVALLIAGLGYAREGYVGYGLVEDDAVAFLESRGVRIDPSSPKAVVDKQIEEFINSTEKEQLLLDVAKVMYSARYPLTQINLWALNRGPVFK